MGNKLTLPLRPSDFLTKIIDAYPATDYLTLREVIGLGKVIYGEEDSLGGMPMTAAVVNTTPYTLIFGRKFVEENLETMADCVYLLSHELVHLVLDHFAEDILNVFTSKKLGKMAMHIVVDCQVNATCYHSLLEPRYFEFIKRFYKKDAMPECFFRHDGEPPTPELQLLHKKLYSVDGITNEELVDGLMPWFEQEQDKLNDHIKKLLGNHRDLLNDKVNDDNLKDLTKACSKVISNYLEDNKENQPEEGQPESDTESEGPGQDEQQDKDLSEGKAAGGGTTLREQQIKACLVKQEYVNNIKNQLKRSETLSPSSRIFEAIRSYLPKKPLRSVLPNFYDRRTVATYSITKRPPIFSSRKEDQAVVVVPCYLDVSGSQNHVLPHTLPVVSRLKDKIGYLVYCFSTEVSPTKIPELKAGKFKSTGGTDFNPVMEHILKNKFKHAVILTDGEATLSTDLQRRIKNSGIKITVGWTVERPQKVPLSNIAEKTFYVFSKNGR